MDTTEHEVKQDTPMRVRVLMRSTEITSRDRNKSYGDPAFNLGTAGRLKQLLHAAGTINEAGGGRKIGPGEWEAIDQVATKLARIVTGPVITEDSYVDAATYAAIAYECARAEEE